MASVQEMFIRLQDIKKQQKDLRTMIKDGLASQSGYKELVEEVKTLRDKKRTIEQNVRAEFAKELDKLDDLKIDLMTEMEELSDAVLTKLMKGEVVKVHDTYNNSYDPIVKISFKKSDDQEQT